MKGRVFFKKVKEGNLEEVKSILQGNPDLIKATGEGVYEWTALHHASEAGQAEIVRFLLEKGMDVNAMETDGEIPLHLAVRYPEIVAILLENGAEVDKQDVTGKTPLWNTARFGDEESYQILLEKGANPDLKDWEFGTTPSEEKKKRQLPPKKIAELLEHALMRLSEKGDKETIEEIVNDDFVVSQEGLQSCLEAAAMGDYIEIIDFWLQNGGEINNTHGCYPLHAAAAMGSVKAIKFLVEKGADLSGCDDGTWGQEENSTPLHAAAGKNYESSVEALLKCGANPDLFDGNYQSPLQIAAEHGDAEMCHILLVNGADVNARSDEGTLTALMWAVRSGNAETVEVLLNFGADPALPCIYEDTLEEKNAFNEAERIGNEEILNLLKNWGKEEDDE